MVEVAEFRCFAVLERDFERRAASGDYSTRDYKNVERREKVRESKYWQLGFLNDVRKKAQTLKLLKPILR